jgi:hypothetical protein
MVAVSFLFFAVVKATQIFGQEAMGVPAFLGLLGAGEVFVDGFVAVASVGTAAEVVAGVICHRIVCFSDEIFHFETHFSDE